MCSEGTRPVTHTEYQHDPIGWIRDKLGVPEHTLPWSLNDGYTEHRWDGTVDPLSSHRRAIVADGEQGQTVGPILGVGTATTWRCTTAWGGRRSAAGIWSSGL